MFLKRLRSRTGEVFFRHPTYPPRQPSNGYEAFLLLYDAPPLGDEFLGAAKIVFGIHLSK